MLSKYTETWLAISQCWWDTINVVCFCCMQVHLVVRCVLLEIHLYSLSQNWHKQLLQLHNILRLLISQRSHPSSFPSQSQNNTRESSWWTPGKRGETGAGDLRGTWEREGSFPPCIQACNSWLFPYLLTCTFPRRVHQDHMVHQHNLYLGINNILYDCCMKTECKLFIVHLCGAQNGLPDWGEQRKLGKSVQWFKSRGSQHK